MFIWTPQGKVVPTFLQDFYTNEFAADRQRKPLRMYGATTVAQCQTKKRKT